MHVLKKLSEFRKSISNFPEPVLKRKNTSYKPATRLQKIKQNKYIYPSSTEDKFVFISNLDGTGFQRQIYLTCPFEIGLDDMMRQLNSACYRQWLINREHYHNNPFKYYNNFTNVCMVLVLILGFTLYMLDAQSSDYISSFLYVFLIFVLVSLIVSLVVYFKKADDFDPDAEMIKTIKKQLQEFNYLESQLNKDNMRFVWTCHKDCLWIAMKVIKFNPIE